MPDADGNLRGISLSGRAGEAWERIFRPKPEFGVTADGVMYVKGVLELKSVYTYECAACGGTVNSQELWEDVLGQRGHRACLT